MTYYVCKTCGRGVRQDVKPMFCYADRMDSMENLSDEDAVKMGVIIPEGERFEFPGDVMWDPDKGSVLAAITGATLHGFQRGLVSRMRLA